MPWWAWVWVVLLVAAAVGGAHDELEQGKRATALLSFLSGRAAVLGILVHFRVPWAAPALALGIRAGLLA